MKTIEKYFEGDFEFAQEVIRLFIENLQELKKSLVMARELQQAKVFLDAHHKMRTTIEFINDTRLRLLTDRLYLQLKQEGTYGIDVREVEELRSLCDSSIGVLMIKLDNLKSMI